MQFVLVITRTVCGHKVGSQTLVWRCCVLMCSPNVGGEWGKCVQKLTPFCCVPQQRTEGGVLIDGPFAANPNALMDDASASFGSVDFSIFYTERGMKEQKSVLS